MNAWPKKGAVKVSFREPTETISSFFWIPAKAAGELGAKSLTSTKDRLPSIKTRLKKKQPSKMLVKMPPAKISMRRPADWRLKLSSLILLKPPKGSQLKLYSVPPIVLAQILGGKPKPNSSTGTLQILANKKCPSSWASKINARKIMAKRMVIFV